jgi:hypothetical protein
MTTTLTQWSGMSNGGDMESKELQLANQQPVETIQERMRQTDLTIETATYWAKQLMKVVEQAGLSKTMSGKKYLEVEGWLIIAEVAHVRAIIEWVHAWKGADGEVIGYEARAVLHNDVGEVIGAGESSCGFDAFPCKGKKGSEVDKAAKSAAQTWAISRALRNKFSFVAKLGGYQAVPAEEMYHDDDRDHQAVPKHAPPVPPSMRVPDKQRKQKITEGMRKRFWGICQTSQIPNDVIKAEVKFYGFDSTSDITQDQYDKLCKWAETWAPPDAPPLEEEPPFPLEEPDHRLVR